MPICDACCAKGVGCLGGWGSGLMSGCGVGGRFVSQGGQILPRGQTFVCAKKQRELARAIKRARVMALIPYSAKLTKFY